MTYKQKHWLAVIITVVLLASPLIIFSYVELIMGAAYTGRQWTIAAFMLIACATIVFFIMMHHDITKTN